MSDDGKDAPSSRAQPTTESQPQNPAETQKQSEKSRDEILQQARVFLQDEAVQKTTPQERMEFLRAKGLSDGDILEILKEVQPASTSTSPSAKKSLPVQQSTNVQEDPTDFSAALVKRDDRPPIVTYPEFLTKPTRPPPLVTANGFLNTVYAFSGLATLVYGTSKFVLEPMVSQLTEARTQYHEKSRDNLSKLVSKLESAVSEIPVYKSKESLTVLHGDEDNDDAVSHYDDPAELFHRDVGVQVSSSDFSTPASPTTQKPESAREYQVRRLNSLISSLKEVENGLVSESDDYADVKTVFNVLKDDLDVLSSAYRTDFVGGFSLYGATGRNEPDDEIKKSKDNIRRIKGQLLSTRSFPTGINGARHSRGASATGGSGY